MCGLCSSPVKKELVDEALETEVLDEILDPLDLVIVVVLFVGCIAIR